MFFFIPVVKTDPQPVFYGWSFCWPSWKSDPQQKNRLGQDSDPQLFAKRRAFAATWWSWAPLWVAGHEVSLGNLASMPWRIPALVQAYRPGDPCLFFFREIVKTGDRLKMNNGCFLPITSGVFFSIEDYIFTIQWCLWVLCFMLRHFLGGWNLILRYFRTKKSCMMCPGSWFFVIPGWGGNQEEVGVGGREGMFWDLL